MLLFAGEMENGILAFKDLAVEKVSIVVPVYNGEKTLSACMNSLLRQTYHELQIILIDDGSQDESLKLCREYARSDCRVEVLTHENHGVSYTRNRGMSAADGSYLMFVDADDIVLPDMVERYVEAISKWHVDIVIGGLHFLEPQQDDYDIRPDLCGTVEKCRFIEMLCADMTGIFGYVPNKIYRLGLLKEHQILFREDMTAQEDLDFALSFYDVAQNFGFIQYCGYLYNHVTGKRQVCSEVLIGNLMKTLRLAEKNGVPVCSLEAVRKKIDQQFFVGCMFSQSAERVRSLIEFDDLAKNLQYKVPLPLEVEIIRRWGAAGKNKRIYHYFLIRRKIKRVLGK